MKILAFDPSSTATGYCVLTMPGEQIPEAGILKPERRADPANDRIRAMIREAQSLIAEQEPDWIIIEDTSGKVAKRHGGGGGAGLAIYGKAVGWFCCMAERLRPGRVITILENEWTHAIPKARRILAITAMYPHLDLSGDAGGDAADAIGLALFAARNPRYFAKNAG